MIKKKRIILGIILVGYFMIILDNSIIFTGTVKIAQTMHLNEVQLSWIQNAYALFFGGFMLLGGRAGDIFGRKRIFELGLFIFAIGSLLVGLATTGEFMIIFRAFQGIGAAIIAPTTLALIMDNFVGKERTKAVAWYGSMAGVGASVSQILGGFFAATVGWRFGFFINVPIAIAMIIMSYKFIPEGNKQPGKFDWLGAIFSLIAVSSLIYAIDGAKEPLLFGVIGLVSLLLFILVESKASQPIMPLKVFLNRFRVGAYIGRIAFTGAMMAFWFFTPQMLQEYLHYSPFAAGIAFLPLTIVTFIFSLQVPKLTNKLGNGMLLLIGITITLIGMVTVIFYQHGYWLELAVPMMIVGVGQGLAFAPLTAAGIFEVNDKNAGAASGVVNVMHQIGAAFGISLVTSLTVGIHNPVIKFSMSMKWISILLLIVVVVTILFILPKKIK
ncbi:MFS transporter [Fructilactobacillus florum]|uniref:MFS transporter n=1 Tax=Fructilactobacillus florum TaxID=640331 RepID=UPI0006D26A73|nr:MFS transporter [Fructilactobacillus florum]